MAACAVDRKYISREASNGEKYLEINKERGAVLATKNHQGGLDDKEDERRLLQSGLMGLCDCNLKEKLECSNGIHDG